MNKYLIIGLGVLGKTLAHNLMDKGNEVVVIDSKMEVIDEIKNDVTYAMCLDSTDEKSLISIGLDEFDVGIICINEDFEATLLTSVLLKNSGIKRIITRASDPMHIKILKGLGISEIITPEIEAANKLANSLIYKNLLDFIPIYDNVTIAKIEAPKSFIGKTIGELNLRVKYGINVISIEHINKIDKKGKDIGKKNLKNVINNNPGADTLIQEKDILIIVCDKNILEKFSE